MIVVSVEFVSLDTIDDFALQSTCVRSFPSFSLSSVDLTYKMEFTILLNWANNSSSITSVKKVTHLNETITISEANYLLTNFLYAPLVISVKFLFAISKPSQWEKS